MTLFTHRKYGKFMKCVPCNLVYVSERPTPPWIELRRIEPYRSLPIPDVLIKRAADLEEESMKVLRRMKQYNDRGRFLEVGVMTGHFLDLARDAGYDVTGVEPDAIAAEYARKTFGLDVYEGTIEELPFEDETFDSAVMIGVLEHLTEPKRALLEVRRLLSDSGVLMIEIPIIDSILFNVMGKYHRHIMMDHILLFSRKALESFLDMCGFYPVHSEICGRNIRLGRIAWHMSDRSLLLGRLSEAVLKLTGLYDYNIKINLRDILQIYCKKKV